MHIREFFYMDKNQRTVLTVLLAVALVCVVLINLLGQGSLSDDELLASPAAEEALGTDGTAAARAYGAIGEGMADAAPLEVQSPKAERFAFDPNTADSTQLRRLGLPPFLVRNIYRYRAHGGVFSQPSDFARLYGLTQKQYRELLPYIRISADYRPAAELVGDRGGWGRGRGGNYPSASGNRSEGAEAVSSEGGVPLTKAGYPVKLKPGEYVVLNEADTTMLKRVPGIGSYYARRITRYGERLGGFVSPEQLLEIEGFPEDALPYFQVDATAVRKLNLNTLSLSKLRQHPYVDFYMARAINDYRRLKGPLKSLDDLRLLPEFPPEVLERLRPYVTF